MPKSWLITGSSRGLGRQVVLAALAAGGNVTATARHAGNLAGLVEEYGDRVMAVSLDVTDPAAAAAAIQTAVATFGRLDVVVNNAGYATLASVEDCTEDEFRSQIETNFFGVVNVVRAALPTLRAQQSGHLIQVSSIGGRTGNAGLAAYQSAKWALAGFTRALAQEVEPLGIKTTVVEPGGMRTDWAGASMTIPAISAPYRESVGYLAEMFAYSSLAPGDPAKVAKIIVELADLDEPPRRLVLGRDAWQAAVTLGRQLAADDERWKHLSLATDYDHDAAAS
jgi:NAD(P)-dependent dehydrogenase (short-subunit alcohol dehydrogenase family)